MENANTLQEEHEMTTQNDQQPVFITADCLPQPQSVPARAHCPLGEQAPDSAMLARSNPFVPRNTTMREI